jgi:hypothetical protein
LPKDRKIFWGVGKVFVEFETAEMARLAHDNIGGMSFAGRTVITAYFDEERYR